MIDPSTAKRIGDSCTEAAQGYCVATGAAYAAVATAWFQTVIETLEAVRPGRSEAEPPKSWYRHPDHIDLMPRAGAVTSWPNAAFQAFNGTAASAGKTTTLPFDVFTAMARANPFAAAIMAAAETPAASASGPRTAWSETGRSEIPTWPLMAPLPGWWSFRATRHPAVTWPMAYGMTLAGVPNPVAWPMAEANAAALDAAQTAMHAFGSAFERPQGTRQDTVPHDDHRHRCTACSGTGRDRTETSVAANGTGEPDTPFAVAMAMQAAGLEAWRAWLDGVSATFDAHRAEASPAKR